jgi:exoribonuclease R
MYKLSVVNINNEDFKYYYNDTMEEVEIPTINPIDKKLFNHDVFNIGEDKTINVTYSVTRLSNSIPGVLVIENNRTFGKTKKKFYYKCVPDDKRLPHFIVPYENKCKSFNKNFKNKFVIFKYVKWIDKHPIGELTNVVGDVDVLENYYEYQLYRKSLHSSINDFTQYTLQQLKLMSEEAYVNEYMRKNQSICDHRDKFIYTIDPIGSRDFDDGFGISPKEDGSITLSIYIANVYIWFDILNLWDAFSNRIATIYLPDRKRPMLPNILSDSLCSLKESCDRFAFVMDVNISSEGNIGEINYYNALINVTKNYVYESPELEINKDYMCIKNMIKKMNSLSKYTSDISDSHDVVAYMMTLMNFHSAKELVKCESGIFRGFSSTVIHELPENLDKNIRKFILYSRGGSGVYELYSNNIQSHDILKMDAYANITSPIRRLVDTLNMMTLIHKKNMLNVGEQGQRFMKHWMSEEQICYISKCMRSIKKIQIDCNLLATFSKDIELHGKEFDGCLYDKIVRTDGLCQYNVYLPELKMSNKYVTSNNIENYTIGKFKLYLFINKDNLRQKIRLNIRGTSPL